MAGLLDDPIAALAAQIRAQYGGSGTGSGNWDDAGYDRAMELAQLLAKQGITNLSDLALKTTPYDEASLQALNAGRGGFDSNGNRTVPDLTLDEANAAGGRQQLQIGDKSVGFLGDYNNDGSYGSNASDFLQGKGDESLLGWSARGDGNTSYRVVTDPSTGQVSIAPGWNSSSDADTARKLAIAAAVIAGGAYGASAMGGAGAGAGTGLGAAEGAAFASPELVGGAFGTGAQLGTAEYAAMAGAGAGGAGGYVSPELVGGSFGPGSAQLGTAEYAAGGIGTLGNTLPAAPGQVAALEPVGQFVAPSLAPASYVPTMAELGAGGGLLNGLSNLRGADVARAGVGLLGAVSGAQGTDPTSNKDPRLTNYLFENNGGGLLGEIDRLYRSMPASGQNATMQQAQQAQRGLINSPEVQAGLLGMGRSGVGLLGRPVAGNPFANAAVGGQQRSPWFYG